MPPAAWTSLRERRTRRRRAISAARGAVGPRLWCFRSGKPSAGCAILRANRSMDTPRFLPGAGKRGGSVFPRAVPQATASTASPGSAPVAPTSHVPRHHVQHARQAQVALVSRDRLGRKSGQIQGRCTSRCPLPRRCSRLSGASAGCCLLRGPLFNRSLSFDRQSPPLSRILSKPHAQQRLQAAVVSCLRGRTAQLP